MTVTLQEALDKNKVELLKNTICKGSSDEEFKLFLHACQRTGLDPFMKQVYAVKRWDSRQKKEVMSIQTGIDGYRLIAERTGKYAPGKEPTYTYDAEKRLLSSTAYVKKQTADGSWHEVAATAFYNEYCQRDKEGNPTRFWHTMAHNQLSKCAEALALRKAFPGDLSGIYTQEEMSQADNDSSVEVRPQTVVELVNADQALEIAELLSECSQEYQQKVMKTLANSNIHKLDMLTLDLYKKLKIAATKQREIFQAQTKELTLIEE